MLRDDGAEPLRFLNPWPFLGTQSHDSFSQTTRKKQICEGLSLTAALKGLKGYGKAGCQVMCVSQAMRSQLGTGQQSVVWPLCILHSGHVPSLCHMGH